MNSIYSFYIYKLQRELRNVSIYKLINVSASSHPDSWFSESKR